MEAMVLAVQFCAYRRALESGLLESDARQVAERLRTKPVAHSFGGFLEQMDELIAEVAGS